jgi:hypothetical protein
MVRFWGPFRIARWAGLHSGDRGVSVSWITRRRIINIELHYERRHTLDCLDS